MSIWDDARVDWQRGDGLLARQLFERAYPGEAAIRTVVDRVGIVLPAMPAAAVPTWTQVLEGAAANGQMLDLAADLLQDADRSWFERPLSDLLGEHLPLAHARLIRRHGFPEDAVKRSALVESVLHTAADGASSALPGALAVPAASGDEGDVGFGLQSITAPQAGIEDLASALAVIRDASRRMALIRRNRVPLGTGFLVGPDLVLTAAHVVDDGAVAASADGLEAVFDFHNLDQPPRAPAETGFPVDVAGVLDLSPPTASERAATAVANWDTAPGELDYALLKLSRRPDDPSGAGGGRGFYRLDPQPADVTLLPPSEIFHFPLGEFLARSPVIGQFTVNASGTRMRYSSNTLVGSSGGAIVDRRGNLIALHHYSIATKNQAVPVWLIASVLAGRGLLPSHGGAAAAVPERSVQPLAGTAVPEENPFDALRVGPRPIVNRHALRTALEDMAGGAGRRALAISGAVDSGVTWSWWLLNHLESRSRLVPALQATAPGGWRAIRVDLRKIATSTDLVGEICGQLPGGVDDEAIAQAARNITEFKRRCREEILGSDQLWWVFVDSVDEPAELRINHVDEILHALLDLADEQQLRLRVVVAGRRVGEIEHDALSWGATDFPSGLAREEVQNWLSDRVAQNGKEVAADALAKFLDEWFPDVDVAPNPVQLALQLEGAVERVAAA